MEETYKNEIVLFKNKISVDRFIVEEAVISNKGLPANDIKLYMFYGQCGFITERMRDLNGETKYCHYDSYGNSLGNFLDGVKYFEGTGVSQQIFEYAKTISINTPIPVLRIDFLTCDDKVYLGEITSHPGNVFRGNLDKMDAYLGQLYLEAEAKLFIDLLKGKKFDTYFNVYGKPDWYD
ncbi:ATP-grasp fold amidoligase family protein [Francisella philomiragia]|uniref:ATP-grasp fold amidoligase family protein n=1 Tax=Francisella philomiragia TaxID=28110 RepID=UPI0001AF7893|nr:ATP-grasp fold amidoligase family protein [Francisella philomiragia]MBK2238180.1 hypothetical protein [Francisella philomiragia]